MTPRHWLRASRRAARGLFDAFAEIGGARLYPPPDPRAAAHRLAATASALARAHDLVVTVHGDVPRSPALLVTARAGYLDALALLPICPALPIAPAAVLAWPVIGSLATAFGVPVVTRADPMARARALRRVYGLLASGVSVVEHAQPALGPHGHPLFRRGCFGLAARLGIPVVPVALRYHDAAHGWAPGTPPTRHYAALGAHARIAIDVAFGAPLWPRVGEPPELMAERAGQRIARLLRVPGAAAQLRVA